MQCEQFDQRVHQILDQRDNPSGDQQLVRHAARCGRCQAQLQAYDQLVRFTGGVTPSGAKQSGLPAGALVKAALAAAILLAFIYGPRPRPRVVPPAATRQPLAVVEAAPRSAAAVQESSSPAVNEAYLMHQPILGLHLLSLADWSDTMPAVDMPFGAELPAVGTQWVEVVTDGMSPLQRPLTSTLRLIRRSVAPSSKSVVRS